jgi:hypothetical protein
VWLPIPWRFVPARNFVADFDPLRLVAWIVAHLSVPQPTFVNCKYCRIRSVCVLCIYVYGCCRQYLQNDERTPLASCCLFAVVAENGGVPSWIIYEYKLEIVIPVQAFIFAYDVRASSTYNASTLRHNAQTLSLPTL